ncbi:MAG: TlyA family RNA methyltransferase [Candidatus Villigracilaceae bacterium]
MSTIDPMPKQRLDILLVERGLAESRTKAQALIMAGQVRVDGQTVLRPASLLPTDSVLTVESGPRFVSRGGEKLEAAFKAFALDVRGKICADVGASTGGFTDCLLQHGAAKVYAIDVGKGLLDWKLRNDPRVVVMEETNARYISALPEGVDFITIDASFISLKILLPVVKRWSAPHVASVVALIKPQFEAGRKISARGQGVIRDPMVHQQVLFEVLTFAQEQGWQVQGLIKSPLVGPKGNVEFLGWLGEEKAADLATLIKRVTGCE